MTSANPDESREAVLERAAQCAAQNQIDEAERILNDALANNPGDALLWFRLGNLYLHAEKPGDAISAFRSALKADPDNPVVLNDLGYALDLAGDANGASDAYARAAASRPPFAPALYNHALRLIGSDSIDAAEAILGKALEAEPELVPAMLAMGGIFEKRGETDKAFAQYQHALTIAPSNTDALLKLAYFEMNRCEFQSAAANFKAYLDASPANEHARFGLGVCLQELGRTDEALDIYRRLLAEDRSRYYAVVKSLLSSGRGVIWLRASELRKALLPDEP